MADSNPMVVANAVAALSEISEFTSSPVLVLNQHTLYKLLAALNECSEWGQVRAPERRVVFILQREEGQDAHRTGRPRTVQ
jgi:vesicle coat complex subunit